MTDVEPTVTLPISLYEEMLAYVENAARGDHPRPDYAQGVLDKLTKLGIYDQSYQSSTWTDYLNSVKP
jgi:hypothetical protein